ncbi:hypothetical protein GCM10011502_01760 [Oceanisphaera marina]|uniref:Uncharacterized protein n=1 Tax=Oceanisphaera marina TaxID=2017550 RepID=A0ABQ1ICW4_9GAMM|nr:hypothetical protein GCM10011502_01760 [Oceanisphaera marina]
MAVSAVYRQLDDREEATEIDSHDREMPWTAFPEPSGMSSWRVVEGDCVASELGFKNDQIFIQVGMMREPTLATVCRIVRLCVVMQACLRCSQASQAFNN